MPGDSPPRAVTAPCPTCPWRADVTDGGIILGFSIERARGLSCTVGDGDAFRPIMACHGSAEGAETPCVGYLAREGYSNVAVRLAAIDGRIDLLAAIEGCEGIDLHPDFDSMLAALEEAEERDG